MVKRFKRKERLSAVSEINVTPLIDLAFSLLIIFMIATPLLEQSIAIELPSEMQKPQQPRPEKKFQVIAIDYQGQYYWGDEGVSEESLKDYLQVMGQGGDAPIIDIRADGRLSYQKVIGLIDLLEQNNLTKISLNTQVK